MRENETKHLETIGHACAMLQASYGAVRWCWPRSAGTRDSAKRCAALRRDRRGTSGGAVAAAQAM